MDPAPAMNNGERSKMYGEIDAIYAELPKISCAGKCQEACGPLLMTEPELERLEKRAGRPLTLSKDLTCSMLIGGRCSAYAGRPLICRLFGLVKDSPVTCPWGCVPERWLPAAEAYRFLDRVKAVAEKYGKAGTVGAEL